MDDNKKKGYGGDAVDRKNFGSKENKNNNNNNYPRKKQFSGSDTGFAGKKDHNGRGKEKRDNRSRVHDGFDDPRYLTARNGNADDVAFYDADEGREDSMDPGITLGRNAVRELLKSGRPIDKIYVKSGNREGSVVVIVAEAISRGIPIVEADQNRLDRISGGGNHQGIVAMSAGKEYCTVDDILSIAAERGEKPLIVVSDGIEDPHNLGALIRCAECSGAHGIIIPKRRNVGVTPVVAKCSAGAIEHMAIAKVTNLATTLKSLKESGIWVFAAEAGGEAYYDADFTVPAAIVFGSEGDGVSRIVKDISDFNVSIPMYGLVNSLNVSTAASVILCHAARVRHGKA